MQSASSTGSSAAIPLVNLPQATSNASSPNPQSHSPGSSTNASTHPTSQSQQPQTAPSAGRTPHSSIFRFRSERAQWLTLAGIILATLALVSAWVYAAEAQRLAEWEAEKDYQLYCLSLKSSSSDAVPPECNAISNLFLPPPPGHNANFFIRTWTIMRRAELHVLKVEASDVARRPTWLHALLATILPTIIGWITYKNVTSQEPDQTEVPSFLGVSAILTPIGLRVVFSACWQVLGGVQGFPMMVIFACCITGHGWAVYGSRNLLGGSYQSVLQIWTLFGLVNAICTDRYSTLWALVSRILAWSSAVSFIQPQWLEIEDTHRCQITGPNTRWVVWRLSHYGSQIGGIFALLDSSRGCSVFGLTGFWLAQTEEYPEPMLPLFIKPLLMMYLCGFGALAFDIFGHVALHRWRRRRQKAHLRRRSFSRGQHLPA